MASTCHINKKVDKNINRYELCTINLTMEVSYDMQTSSFPTFFIDSRQGENSVGDSGFSCLTLTGGGEVVTGDAAGSGIPWVLLLLFLTGSSLGTWRGTPASNNS